VACIACRICASILLSQNSAQLVLPGRCGVNAAQLSSGLMKSEAAG
jgi:hypothetical protein